MTAERPNPVPTGVEPIDEAIGGLERGRVHLLYGELETGKTTMALRFLAEGLARGERCLLVTRNRADETVERFAEAGRPCDADLDAGTLAIFEFAVDLVDLLGRFEDLQPILEELETMTAEHRPDRIVFDTADFVFSIQHGYGHPLQISAFMHFLGATGATSLLVAEERTNERIVQSFRANAPAVMHTILRRFPDRVEHHLAFEKGSIKAPHRRIAYLGAGRFATVEVYDARARTLPLPAYAGRRRSAGDRTGQLSLPEEAAAIVAEAVASSDSGPLADRPEGGTMSPSGSRGGRPRVLLVDADRVTALLAARALEPDCDLAVETDGIAGLTRIGTLDPDVVVVELDMPLVDGFAVCRQIREMSLVPIVAISSSRASEADRMRSAEAGADLFLAKPFGLREFGLRVRQLVARYRGLPPPFAATLPEPIADPLVPFDRVVALLATGAAGKTLLGCRVGTRSASQTARVVDTVRSEIRPDDVLAYDTATDRLVVLVSPDAASDTAALIARRVRDVVGVMLQVQVAPVSAAPVRAGEAMPVVEAESP